MGEKIEVWKAAVPYGKDYRSFATYRVPAMLVYVLGQKVVPNAGMGPPLASATFRHLMDWLAVDTRPDCYSNEVVMRCEADDVVPATFISGIDTIQYRVFWDAVKKGGGIENVTYEQIAAVSNAICVHRVSLDTGFVWAKGLVPLEAMPYELALERYLDETALNVRCPKCGQTEQRMVTPTEFVHYKYMTRRTYLSPVSCNTCYYGGPIVDHIERMKCVHEGYCPDCHKPLEEVEVAGLPEFFTTWMHREVDEGHLWEPPPHDGLGSIGMIRYKCTFCERTYETYLGCGHDWTLAEGKPRLKGAK